MLSKLTGQAASSQGSASAAAQKINIFEATKIDGSNLPPVTKSAFRKRPVRLTYDKNEFYSFRMPSEHHFLMQNFEKADIFGKRKGLEHSPNIRNQMGIDQKILYGLVGASIVMLLCDFKRNGLLLDLRENFRGVTDGRFQADDFIVKKQ